MLAQVYSSRSKKSQTIINERGGEDSKGRLEIEASDFEVDYYCGERDILYGEQSLFSW